MAFLLLFGAIFCVILCYFFILIRNYIARERASENRIITNLTMLNLEAESLAKFTIEKVDKDDRVDLLDFLELWGYPPDKEQVIEQIIKGDQAEDNWDYAIHIHEGAEQYLGPEQFIGLEDRVASIPGVDKCQREEKCVFLIFSKSYSREILIELFWREFLHAAEVASIKKST